MNLTAFLRRWHILDPFNLDEAKEAEIENVLRDHTAAVTRVESSNNGVRASQGKLRESIRYARISSESTQSEDRIAQLVRDMRSSGQHRP